MTPSKALEILKRQLMCEQEVRGREEYCRVYVYCDGCPYYISNDDDYELALNVAISILEKQGQDAKEYIPDPWDGIKPHAKDGFVARYCEPYIQHMKNLPSAQPFVKDTNVPVKSELISRQAAIDAVCMAGCGSGHCGISCDDVKAIEMLPSAQPDWNEMLVICDNCGHAIHVKRLAKQKGGKKDE